MGIKYVDEKGSVYQINAEGKGENFKLVKVGDNKYHSEVFDSEEMAEKGLLKYAQENDLIPLAIKNIADDESMKLQGTVFEGNDYKKLTDSEIKEKAQEYVETMEQIKSVKDDAAFEIKQLKEESNNTIAELEKKAKELSPLVKTGLDKEVCDVSWERDVDAEMMILIRRDNYKPINFRPMTEAEKNPTLFDTKEESKDDTSDAAGFGDTDETHVEDTQEPDEKKDDVLGEGGELDESDDDILGAPKKK